MTTPEWYARTLATFRDRGYSIETAIGLTEAAMKANDRQVGGEHYKKGGEEHWDRAWRLKYDPFQYIVTKWVERWKEKGGIQDLLKAQHALEKYIEVQQAELPSGVEVRYGPNPLETVEDGRFSERLMAEWLRRVKPTGWEGFVFEGADAKGYHYTCKNCMAQLFCGQFTPPMAAHECGTEPGRSYVDPDL